jgi:putative transposase
MKMKKKVGEFKGSVYRYRLKLTKLQSDIIDGWINTTLYLQNKTLRYYINDYDIANTNYLDYLSSKYPRWYSLWEIWNKNVLLQEANKFIIYIEKKEGKPLPNEKREGIIKKIQTNWHIKQIPPEFYYYGAPVKHQGGGETSTYQYYSWLKENEPMSEIRDKLNDVPATVAQDSLERVHSAYASFFKGGGFPKFKRFNNSVTWSNSPPYTSIRVTGNIIRLSKIGDLKFIRHRDPPQEGIIKKVNITKTNNGKYFVNIFYAHKIEPTAHPTETIGFDRNIRIEHGEEHEQRNYATGYNGKSYIYIKQPTFYRDENIKLKKAQRKVSKLEEELKHGTTEWKKARHVVNKIQERINNRKNNWIHEQTREIANNYKHVILEDLSIKDMTNKEKGKHKSSKKPTKSEENKALTLEKAKRRGFNETAHYKFETALKYKLEWNGGTLLKTPSPYTSQTCSNCGEINNTLNLSMESWKCSNCGKVHNRDENAAVNIYNKYKENENDKEYKV